MPRVLFVIDSLEVGGAERSLLELCRHSRRFEPVVCHLSPAAALAQRFDAAGVPTLNLGLETRYPFLAGARALTHCIRTVDPDLIHSTLYNGGITARLAARGDRPLAHTWVNEPVIHPRRPDGIRWRHRLAHMLDARTAFRVSHFIANSRAVAGSNRRALGVSEERVSGIHRGRDPDRASRVRRQHQRRHDDADRRCGRHQETAPKRSLRHDFSRSARRPSSALW